MFTSRSLTPVEKANIYHGNKFYGGSVNFKAEPQAYIEDTYLGSSVSLMPNLSLPPKGPN